MNSEPGRLEEAEKHVINKSPYTCTCTSIVEWFSHVKSSLHFQRPDACCVNSFLCFTSIGTMECWYVADSHTALSTCIIKSYLVMFFYVLQAQYEFFLNRI